MPRGPQRKGPLLKLYAREKPNQFSVGRGQKAFSLPAFSSPESRNEFLRNVNPDQMQILVDPVEHRDRLEKSLDLWIDPSRSMSGMMGRKTEESKQPEGAGWGAGIVDWMSRGEAMRSPITIHVDEEGDFVQGGGHHRLAGAAHMQETTGEQHLVPAKFVFDEVPHPLSGTAESGEQTATMSDPERRRAQEATPAAAAERLRARRARRSSG